jgi:hypothetical protein
VEQKLTIAPHLLFLISAALAESYLEGNEETRERGNEEQRGGNLAVCKYSIFDSVSDTRVARLSELDGQDI